MKGHLKKLSDAKGEKVMWTVQTDKIVGQFHNGEQVPQCLLALSNDGEAVFGDEMEGKPVEYVNIDGYAKIINLN